MKKINDEFLLQFGISIKRPEKAKRDNQQTGDCQSCGSRHTRQKNHTTQNIVYCLRYFDNVQPHISMKSFSACF